MSRFILASSSPRRIELLRALNMDFDIIPSNYEENIIQKPPHELVCEFARSKAMDVAKNLSMDKVIISADTIVYKDDEILGKPKSRVEAYKMLKKLSGSSHSVITGICVIDKKSGKIFEDYEETVVFFKVLTDIEINDYINSGEPMDKAGAYGIQGLGGIFVEKIEGCYFNVVGLPVFKLNKLLGKMGVNLLVKGV
jgi:septum formation protein